MHLCDSLLATRHGATDVLIGEIREALNLALTVSALRAQGVSIPALDLQLIEAVS